MSWKKKIETKVHKTNKQLKKNHNNKNDLKRSFWARSCRLDDWHVTIGRPTRL